MTKKTASEKETNNSPKERAEAKPEAKNKPQEKAGNKAETKAKARPKTRRSKSKPAAKAKEAATEPVKEEEKASGPQAKASDAAAAEEKQAKPKTKKKPRGRPKKASPKEASAPETPPELTEAPSEEAAKAEPQGQTDALPEAAAEQETKPKPRRKKKKKAKTAEAPTPAAEPEIAEQAVPAKKHGKKKPTPKKGGRTEREVKVGVERVVIASENPAKIKAVELGFARMFPGKEFVFEGMSAESGVSDQPMSDDETFAGALNRASTAREEQADADYWIGLEGGLQEEGDDFFAFAWIVVLGPKGMQGKSRTGTFVIPPAVSELVRSGKELGEADDIVFSQTNSKQSSGAIGILTHGILDRANYYAEAVLMALIPFKNPSLYLLEEVIETEED